MSTLKIQTAGLGKSYIAFQAFKYSVYILLSYNIFLFFQEDFAASAQTFTNGITFYDIGEAFSATIDTAAWVVLILLFELETFVLDDEKIVGTTKTLLHSIRSVCYALIVYSLYGYIVKLNLVLNTLPYSIDDACSLIDTAYTYIYTLDEYMPIEASNCAALNNGDLLRIADTQIISTVDRMQETQRLAWLSVFNSIDWLLIVAILEVDVYLQLKGRLEGRVRTVSKVIKTFLYSFLFIAAIYWGIKGDFLDFWDAFLWLVAFIFIEMNIFEWHAESKQEAEAAQS